jgi:GTP:adenosylcobinamide-phosphate guanylyltransferase
MTSLDFANILVVSTDIGCLERRHLDLFIKMVTMLVVVAALMACNMFSSPENVTEFCSCTTLKKPTKRSKALLT